MTLDQALALAVVLGMVVLFVWDRLRYDLVALLVAMGVGIVPPDKAFAGFSDQVITNPNLK
jgi:di/tricarboxylate transporter